MGKYDQKWWVWLGILAILIVFPFMGDMVASKYNFQLLIKILISTMAVFSLQLLVGYGGMVTMGHAAFFGVGAYMAALVSPQYTAGNGWQMVGLAMVVCGLLGLVIGALVVRVRGIYFIMTTLAFGQAIFYIFHDNPFAGGSDGIYIYVKPTFWGIPANTGQVSGFYWVVLMFFVASAGFWLMVQRSNFAGQLRAINDSETRMVASGYNPYLYRLSAFGLSTMMAGMAGALYAMQYGYTNPEVLGWHQSANMLLMAILGGVGGFLSSLLGVVVFVYLGEVLIGLSDHWQLYFGVFIVLAVALMPAGIIGVIDQIKAGLGGKKP